MQDNHTIEQPPEVQFAGISRWLKENIYQRFGINISPNKLLLKINLGTWCTKVYLKQI